MPLNMKNINNFTQWKKWISQCDIYARNHAPKAPRAVWAQYTECSGHFQYTPRLFTKEPIREQETKLECMKSDFLFSDWLVSKYLECVENI